MENFRPKSGGGGGDSSDAFRHRPSRASSPLDVLSPRRTDDMVSPALGHPGPSPAAGGGAPRRGSNETPTTTNTRGLSVTIERLVSTASSAVDSTAGWSKGSAQLLPMGSASRTNQVAPGRSARSKKPGKQGTMSQVQRAMRPSASGRSDGYDPRFTWVQDTVCSALALQTDEFNYMLHKVNSAMNLQAFLDDKRAPRLYFFLTTGDEAWAYGASGLMCAASLPSVAIARQGCLCMLKEGPAKVSTIDPSSGIIMTDVRGGALQNLLGLTKDAVFPMLQLPQNRKGLNHNALKEFSYSCEEFVGSLDILAGKVQGHIVLPLPQGFQVAKPEEVAKQRDAVRILECAVLAWTKQIRWTLSKEVNDHAYADLEPKPTIELDFWTGRSRELHAILEQLRHPKLRNAVEVLRLCHSSYCEPLNRAIAEVEAYSVEADSTATYLETLRPYLEALEDTSRSLFRLDPLEDEVIEVEEEPVSAPFQGDVSQGIEHRRQSTGSMSFAMSEDPLRRGSIIQGMEEQTSPIPRYGTAGPQGLSDTSAIPWGSPLQGTAQPGGFGVPGTFTQKVKESPPARWGMLDSPKAAARHEPLDPGEGAEEAPEGESMDWVGAVRPVMHLLFLIVSHSPYYNSFRRLNSLVRLLEAVTIRRARLFVLNGWDVSRGRNSVMVEDRYRTTKRLELVIDACLGLKQMYKDYEEFNGSRLEPGETNVYTSGGAGAQFSRLDAYVERFHDVLCATTGAVRFQVFKDMSIGGTNGRQNTAKARQLYADMEVVIRQFTSVDYDLLEISTDNSFEDNYAQFTASYKSLQLQAVTLHQQAYEDLAQPTAIAELLVAFSTVLSGDMFRIPVDKISADTVELFAADLRRARMEFVSKAVTAEEAKQDFIGTLPPVAGRIIWTSALRSRVLLPWQHLAVLGDTHIRQSEGADEIAAQAAGLCEAIDRSVAVAYDHWYKKAETIPSDVLKTAIVLRTLPTAIAPNLASELVLAFREAKYLLQLGYEIPEGLAGMYVHADTIRVQSVKLQLLADRYNAMHRALLEPEHPLVAARIEALDAILLRGERDIRWRSHVADDFLASAQQLLDGILEVLARLRALRDQLEVEVLQRFADQPLFRRNEQKTYTVNGFSEVHFALVHERAAAFAKGEQEMRRAVEASMEACGANWTQAGWIKYVEYLNSIVSDWLLEHLTQTLAFFLDQVRDALSSTDNNLSSTQMTRVPSQKPRQLTHTHSLSATLRARPLPRAPSAAMDGEGAGLMGGVKTERAPLLETRLQITNNEMVYFPTIWPQSHKQTTKRLMKEESLGVSQESYEKTNIAFLNRGHSIASDVSICGSVLAWLQSIIHFLRIASHPSAPLLHQEARNASQVAPAPDVEVDLHFAVDHCAAILANETVTSYIASINAASTSCANLTDTFRNQFNAFRFLLEEDLQESFDDFLAMAGMPPDRPHGLPDVVAFVHEVGNIVSLKLQLDDIPDINKVGFIRIDTRPLKAALSKDLATWKLKYCGFLAAYLSENFAYISNFISTTRQAFSTASTNANSSAEGRVGQEELMKMLEAQLKMKTERERLEALLDTLEEILVFLLATPENAELITPETEPQFGELNSAVSSGKGGSFIGDEKPKEIKMDPRSRLEARLEAWSDLQRFALQVKGLCAADIESVSAQIQIKWAKLCDDSEAAFLSVQTSVKIWHAKENEDDEETYRVLGDRHSVVAALQVEHTALLRTAALVELQLPQTNPALASSFAMLACGKALCDQTALFNSTLEAWLPLQVRERQPSAILVQELYTMLERINPALLEPPMNSPKYDLLHHRVSALKDTLPLLTVLISPAVRPRHLKQLMALAGVMLNLDQAMSLQDALAFKLPSIPDDVETIVSVAQREEEVEKRLEALSARWRQLVITPEKSGVELDGTASMPLLAPSTHGVMVEMQGLQGELQLALQSRFVSPMRERCAAMQRQVAMGEAAIASTLGLQAKWMRLRGLIRNTDSRGTGNSGSQNFSKETRSAFEAAERIFFGIMTDITSHKTVESLLLVPELHKRLDNVGTMLTQSEAELSKWLALKRNAFPRFFFLSDEELTHLLSEGSKGVRHIFPMFPRFMPGVKTLVLNKKVTSSGNDVTGITSSQGELLTIDECPFNFGLAQFEQSLVDLLLKIERRLSGMIHNVVMQLTTGDMLLVDAVKDLPLQVSMVARSVLYTSLVEKALDRRNRDEVFSNLEVLQGACARTAVVFGDEIRNGDPSQVARMKLSCNIVSETHHAEVLGTLRDLARDHAGDGLGDMGQDFLWQMPMRFYLRDVSTLSQQRVRGHKHADRRPGSCKILIGHSSIDYGYEFLPSAGVFYIAPQTYRALLACAAAAATVSVGALGAPLGSGTGGSGKTQLFRSLAVTCGKHACSFSCSSVTSYHALSNFFIGVVSAGSWGLFERFDDLRFPQLSIIANALHHVANAVRAREGDEMLAFNLRIQPSPHLAFFCSFSPPPPSGSGPGRKKDAPPSLHPDLVNLIRPISVTPPDMNAVLRVLLLSEGFEAAASVASRAAAALSLAASLFEPATHDPDPAAHALAATRENLAGGTIVSPGIARGRTFLDLRSIRAAVSVAGAKLQAHRALRQPNIPEEDAEGESERSWWSDGSESELSFTNPESPPSPLSPSGGAPTNSLLLSNLLAAPVKVMKLDEGAVRGREGAAEAVERWVLREALEVVGTALLRETDRWILSRLLKEALPGKDRTRPDMKPGDMRPEAAGGTSFSRVESLNSVGVGGLQFTSEFWEKVKMLNDLLDVRSEVFVIGPAGSGKSTLWRNLARGGVQERVGRGRDKITWYAVSPHAMPLQYLFGHYDPDAGPPPPDGGPAQKEGRWVPGCLSNILKGYAAIGDSADRWVIIDGQVSPDWLALIDSALDCSGTRDARSLRLQTSGEIPLGPSVRIIIESCSLAHVAPGSVGKAGIMVLTPSDVGPETKVQAWLQGLQRESLRQELIILFQERLSKLLQVAKHEELRTVAPSSAMSSVCGMLRILEGAIDAIPSSRFTPATCAAIFDLAAVWGFGGALSGLGNVDARKVFSEWWREELVTFGGIPLPSIGNVFDYAYDPVTFSVCTWHDFVSKTKYLGIVERDVMVISTPFQVCCARLLALHTSSGAPMLLSGAHGSGKTTAIMEHLTGQPDDVAHTRVALHRRADARYLQRTVAKALTKKAGRLLAPAHKRKLVVFVDDASLPLPDSRGVRSAHALLVHHITYGTWFDYATLEQHEVADMSYLAALLPAIGHDPLDPRLAMRFTVVGIDYPDIETMQSLFHSLVASLLTDFSSGVKACIEPLAAATAALFETVKSRMGGAKSGAHCTLSLHQLTALARSLSMATPDVYSTAADFMSLWRHETHRILADRIPTEKARGDFEACVRDVIRLHVPEQGGGVPTGPSQLHVLDPVLGIVRPARMDPGELRLHFEKSQKDYNLTLPAMDLVLHDEMVAHILRVARALLSPHTSSLIVCGPPGVGRRSLTRLAAFASGVTMTHPTISRHYSLDTFRADLEALMVTAAAVDTNARGRPSASTGGGAWSRCAFMVSGEELETEAHLLLLCEMVHGNMQWNAGEEDAEAGTEELGLFRTKDSRKAIAERVRAGERGANDEGGSGTPSEREYAMFWDLFVSRARKSIRVVLCLTPASLAAAAHQAPPLVHRADIDFIPCWSDEAFAFVAHRRLAGLAFATDARESERIGYALEHLAVRCFRETEKIAMASLEHHGSVECTVSAVHFFSLVQSLGSLFAKRQNELEARKHLIVSSMSKMADLDQRASRMEEEKGEWQVEIGKQDRVVQQLLQDVGRRTTELEAMRNMLKKQEANAVAILAKLRATRRKLADSVDEVTPKLQSATELLKAMNKGELSEIKSFSLPPVHLEKVFSTVLILMANNYSSQLDVSWSRVRQTISAVDRFVIKLLQFDPETIEKASAKAAKEILLPDPLLAPEVLAKHSPAAEILVRWMRAILAYHTAFLEDISPLTQEVKEQEKEVDEANKLVAATKVGLGEAEEAIRELTTLFEQATHEKSTMVSSRDQSASLHQRALELSNFLSAQTVEWVRARNDLTQALITLPGDALVAAVLLSLGGPLSVRFRAQLLEGHLKTALNNSDVPSSGKARRMLDVLLPVHEACVEYMRGLTHPRLSLTCSFADYNCAVAMNAPRAALLVDPDAQARAWLAGWEREGLASSVQHGIGAEKHGQCLDCIKTCLRLGRTCVITVEDVASASPALCAVLQMRVLRKGTTLFLEVEKELVEYDESFRLFIRTPLMNPNIPSQISALVTVVNFELSSAITREILAAAVFAASDPQGFEKTEAATEICIQETIEMHHIEKALLEGLSFIHSELVESEVMLMVRNEMESLTVSRARLSDAKQDMSEGKARTHQYHHLVMSVSELLQPVREIGRLFKGYATSTRVLVAIAAAAIRDATHTLQDAELKKTNSTGSNTSTASIPTSTDGTPKMAGRTPSSGMMLTRRGTAKFAYKRSETSGHLVLEDTSNEGVAAKQILDATLGALLAHVLGGMLHRDRAEPAAAMLLKGLVANGSLTQESLVLFLDGVTSDEAPSMEVHGWVAKPAFLSAKGWALLIALMNATECIRWVPQHMAQFRDEWIQWYESRRPEEISPPSTDNKEVTALERLLIVRAVRPERTSHALYVLLEAASAGGLAQFPTYYPDRYAPPKEKEEAVMSEAEKEKLNRNASFNRKFSTPDEPPPKKKEINRGNVQLSDQAKRALLGGTGGEGSGREWLRMTAACAGSMRVQSPGVPQSMLFTEPVPVLVILKGDIGDDEVTIEGEIRQCAVEAGEAEHDDKKTALGDGQGVLWVVKATAPNAMSRVIKASVLGKWILVKSLHLAPALAREIDDFLEALGAPAPEVSSEDEDKGQAFQQKAPMGFSRTESTVFARLVASGSMRGRGPGGTMSPGLNVGSMKSMISRGMSSVVLPTESESPFGKSSTFPGNSATARGSLSWGAGVSPKSGFSPTPHTSGGVGSSPRRTASPFNAQEQANSSDFSGHRQAQWGSMPSLATNQYHPRFRLFLSADAPPDVTEEEEHSGTPAAYKPHRKRFTGWGWGVRDPGDPSASQAGIATRLNIPDPLIQRSFTVCLDKGPLLLAQDAAACGAALMQRVAGLISPEVPWLVVAMLQRAVVLHAVSRLLQLPASRVRLHVPLRLGVAEMDACLEAIMAAEERRITDARKELAAITPPKPESPPLQPTRVVSPNSQKREAALVLENAAAHGKVDQEKPPWVKPSWLPSGRLARRAWTAVKVSMTTTLLFANCAHPVDRHVTKMLVDAVFDEKDAFVAHHLSEDIYFPAEIPISEESFAESNAQMQELCNQVMTIMKGDGEAALREEQEEQEKLRRFRASSSSGSKRRGSAVSAAFQRVTSLDALGGSRTRKGSLLERAGSGVSLVSSLGFSRVPSLEEMQEVGDTAGEWAAGLSIERVKDLFGWNVPTSGEDEMRDKLQDVLDTLTTLLPPEDIDTSALSARLFALTEIPPPVSPLSTSASRPPADMWGEGFAGGDSFSSQNLRHSDSAGTTASGVPGTQGESFGSGRGSFSHKGSAGSRAGGSFEHNASAGSEAPFLRAAIVFKPELVPKDSAGSVSPSRGVGHSSMRRGSSLRSVNSTGVKFSVNFNLASEAVEKEESPRKVDTDASKVASTFDAPATFERTGMPANESLQSPLMSDEGSPMRVRRNLPGASSPAISPPSGRREGGIEGRGGGSQEGSPLQGGEEGRMLGSPQLQRRTTLEEYQSGHAGQFPLRPRKRRSQGVESGRARSTERRPVLNLDARLSWEAAMLSIAIRECQALNRLRRWISLDVEALEVIVMQHSGHTSSCALESSLATCAALVVSRVPPSWSQVAFSSVVALPIWLSDLSQRFSQAGAWAADPPFGRGKADSHTEHGREEEHGGGGETIRWSALCRPNALVAAVMLQAGVVGDGWLAATQEVAVLDATIECLFSQPEMDPNAATKVTGLRFENAVWNEARGKIEPGEGSVLPLVFLKAPPKTENRSASQAPGLGGISRLLSDGSLGRDPLAFSNLVVPVLEHSAAGAPLVCYLRFSPDQVADEGENHWGTGGTLFGARIVLDVLAEAEEKEAPAEEEDSIVSERPVHMLEGKYTLGVFTDAFAPV